jgi:hypothetical protein
MAQRVENRLETPNEDDVEKQRDYDRGENDVDADVQVGKAGEDFAEERDESGWQGEKALDIVGHVNKWEVDRAAQVLEETDERLDQIGSTH